ncbi:hypothetical protein DY000_02059796 [Brassica cretica]|uniref:Uncharacterized protein n=1 Tax=Brassica cretica TaxID=69181 RepID=A0ABQ7B0W5_BRACR|nr:hypothetical protein DY000_02059796 [Brassica cretica]
MVFQASATSRNAEDSFFFRMPRFMLEMFAGLKMFRDIARDVFTQIAKDVVGQGLDHGTLTFKGQRALVEIDRPSLQELSVLRWLIVIEDDSMFRKMYPKRFNTELVRSQLRDDCLLGCDRGERNAEASEPHG